MSSTTINVIPTGAALGAALTGVDLSCVDEAEFESIHQAWIDHEVLLFRDQALTDSDLIAFSRLMGVLEHAPIQESGRRFVEGYPEIYVVSNVIENNVPIVHPLSRLGNSRHIERFFVSLK
jgi:taurine dioxygenase